MRREPARVLVIGDGVAGTAAAVAAARLGARVTVASAGAGASVLSSGAVDDAPWDEVVMAARTAGAEPRARPVSPEVTAFARELGVWRIPEYMESLPLLATCAGVVRPARGHDVALLDLATVNAGVVIVPRAFRAQWDAAALAAAWGAEPSLSRRGISFVPVDVPLFRYEGEHLLSDTDLAAVHDDPGRLEWLSARLREAIARTAVHPVGVILGPWLGAVASRAAELSRRLGVACGEALGGAGGPAGQRLAAARDRLFGAAGVARAKGRVASMSIDADDEGRPRVEIVGEDAARVFDRVVIACGGLVGGGIVFDPLDGHAGADMPERYWPPHRLSFEVISGDEDELSSFGEGGERIGVVGSMFGPDLSNGAWPRGGRAGRLESIGLSCDEEGLLGPRLAVAGDVVADRPRTMLVAARSGLAAGSWAATR